MLAQFPYGQETEIAFQFFPRTKVKEPLILKGIDIVLDVLALAEVFRVTGGKRAEEKRSAGLQFLINRIPEVLPFILF